MRHSITCNYIWHVNTLKCMYGSNTFYESWVKIYITINTNFVVFCDISFRNRPVFPTCQKEILLGSMKMAGPCLGFLNWICHYFVGNLSVLIPICRNLSESPDKVIDKIVGPAIFIVIFDKTFFLSVGLTIPIYHWKGLDLSVSMMYRLSKNC